MKVGRRIQVRAPSLRRIRYNLRKLFYKALEDYFSHLADQGLSQYSSGNWVGVRKLDKIMKNHYELLFSSICKCFDCNCMEEDAVFFSEELYYPLFYPPIEISDKEPRTYWLCPVCYQKRIDKLDKWKKEKYYIFHLTGEIATLEQLGLRNLEEYRVW